MISWWSSIHFVAWRNLRCKWVGSAPGAFAPALHMQDAALSQSEESLVLAGAQGFRAFPAVAKQMCRLVGPRGSAARQDVLVAADFDVSSNGETDFEARLAHREAKKKSEGKKTEDGDAKKSENEVKGGGQFLSGFSRRAGIRPAPKCDGGYHLAPERPLKDAHRNESAQSSPSFNKVPRPPCP